MRHAREIGSSQEHEQKEPTNADTKGMRGGDSTK